MQGHAPAMEAKKKIRTRHPHASFTGRYKGTVASGGITTGCSYRVSMCPKWRTMLLAQPPCLLLVCAVCLSPSLESLPLSVAISLLLHPLLFFARSFNSRRYWLLEAITRSP
ncbi:hypothetical protein CI102_1112 [Trichoderma harzianum]|nr:hypothetical protein CI102_1112 [Trichoderma harzianum]